MISGQRLTNGRSKGLLLLVLISFGAMVRAWLAFNNSYPSVDGVFYMEQSRQLLLTGQLPFSSFPPGWPLLFSLPLAFMDCSNSAHVLLAAKSTNVFFGSLLPLLTYFFLKSRTGSGWAFFGSFLLLILPMNLLASRGDLSDMSFSCFLLTACLLTRRKLDFSGGLLLGYSYLIRPEAGLIAGLLWLVHLCRERQIPWLFSLGNFSIVIPYVVFIKISSGQWSLSGKGSFLVQSFSERSANQYLQMLVENSGKFFGFVPELLGFPLILMACWGLWIEKPRWVVFLAPLLIYPLFDFAMAHRYWLPYLPLIILASWYGGRDLFRRLAEKLAGKWNSKLLVTGLCLVAVLGFVQTNVQYLPHLKKTTESYYGLRDAGLWLSEYVDPETKVAAYKPYASFWAGCSFVKFALDETDPVAIVDDARNRGAKYLIANAMAIYRFIPELAPLIRQPVPPDIASRVKLIHARQYESEVQNTAIFLILDPEANRE